jgi:hypothetical protein
VIPRKSSRRHPNFWRLSIRIGTLESFVASTSTSHSHHTPQHPSSINNNIATISSRTTHLHLHFTKGVSPIHRCHHLATTSLISICLLTFDRRIACTRSGAGTVATDNSSIWAGESRPSALWIASLTSCPHYSPSPASHHSLFCRAPSPTSARVNTRIEIQLDSTIFSLLPCNRTSPSPPRSKESYHP